MPMIPAMTEEKRTPVFACEITGSGLAIYMSNVRPDPVGYMSNVRPDPVGYAVGLM